MDENHRHHANHEESSAEHDDGPLNTQVDTGSKHTKHGTDSSHSDHVEQYHRLFWLMLFISIPVVTLSPMFASLLGYDAPSWGLWVAPILGTFMYVVGGKPFLQGALDEITKRQPGMMLLISLAITVAFIASWGATLQILDHHLEFWWELALLIVIVLLGHWIEMRALAQTSGALDSLTALLPDEAEKVEGDAIVAVAPEELQVDDLIIVRPGAHIPADGRVIEGTANINESMLTGESKSVRKTIGDSVVAGTIAIDSGLRVQVTAIGDNTTLAGIQRLVAEAQSSSSNAQRIADRAAEWLFWFAIIAASITALAWTSVGALDRALSLTITVLVIACPHALGLAIPLVVSIAVERAAKHGVLIKDRLALESMRTIDTVVFDKTGTLTKGTPAVTAIESVLHYSDKEVLALAAATEADSEHPLARAIVSYAKKQNIEIVTARDFSSSPAIGVRARVANRIIEVGGPHLLHEYGLDALKVASEWSEQGATILYVLADGILIGALKLTDEVRPESREVVEELHNRGIQVMMITGDAHAVAASVSHELGIDRFYAGARPEEKAAKIGVLQSEGRSVAFVGDGVNDAPALAKANVGLAIGAGTDVAIASAGLILASNDPRAVVSTITLSDASYKKMRQNLMWAAGYNLLTVPLAAGILAPLGFYMPMSVGAILMSVSTIIVALNAQLLRRLEL